MRSDSSDYLAIALIAGVILLIGGVIAYLLFMRQNTIGPDQNSVESDANQKLTQIIGMISGGLFIFSFLVLGVGSYKIYGSTISISGWQIIRSSFDSGRFESVLFGLILVLSVIAAISSTLLYFKSNAKLASKMALACIGCILIDFVILVVKFESLSIVKFLGVGAWLSILFAASMALTPKISKLINAK